MAKDKIPTLEELKAKAYDLIALKEQAERELQAVNNMIASYKAEPKGNK